MFKSNIGIGPPGRLVVHGGELRQTLLETDEAYALGFYDRSGRLVAVFRRLFDDDVWAFSTLNDADWGNVLGQLGVTGSGPVVVK